MASIENRSRYTVNVKHRDDLCREFQFVNLEQAKQYAMALQAQGLKPALTQGEDAYFIRIRQRGYPAQSFTFGTRKEAEDTIARVEAERRSGLFTDYTKAHKVTFEDMLRRYIEEEGPKNKGWSKVEKYKCLGWLEDLEGTGKRGKAGKVAKSKSNAAAVRPMMRKPATAIQWMRKPLAEIQTTDIEDYMRDRALDVAPATIDRELDVIRAILTVATKVWKHRLSDNPMDGVRRPKYFNERDRRLKGDEAARLLTAAIEEDRLRSIALRAEQLMAEERTHAKTLPTTYARKRHIQQALEIANEYANADYVHIPLYETYIQFQIMTAARRGETLSLRWDDVDFELRSAYLAETKNGRPRKLPLRAGLMDMMERLPRDSCYVFPIAVDMLQNAWTRIVTRAGIEDLHIHDLRHEGISKVAETSAFSLIDLQAFSGHRDVRMLLRYAHLCTTQLAAKLDEAFAGNDQGTLPYSHRGRKRIRSGQGLSMADIAADAPTQAPQPQQAKTNRTAKVIPLFAGR